MIQDGRFLIETSPDGMWARGTFIPGVGEGHVLAVSDVDYELRSAGVCHGVDWALVERMVATCQSEVQIIRDVVVARGTPSRAAVPSCLVFHPAIQALDAAFLPPEKRMAASSGGETPHVAAGQLDARGNIDFREIHGLFIIHEGQLLARRRAAVEGMPGTTVLGGYVPFTTMDAPAMDPGDHIRIDSDSCIAGTNGKFAWNSHSFWIEETLELAEDVGYHTGNIRFPGNLILKAGVKDRFKVWVGGNLGATAVLDAYEIFCGGSMDAKAGIIGRSKGLVRVKGSLTTRFAEHCDIEVLGNMELEIASLNSEIYCLGELKTGDKGRLVGGHVQARMGISAATLGNASGAHTLVCGGTNYVTHRKMDYAREKLQQLQPVLAKVEEKYRRTSEPSLMVQAQRLKDEVDKYQSMISGMMDALEDNDLSAITVTGTVNPGVVVDICGIQLNVTKPLKAVRFRLDRGSGKIVVENLSKS